MLKEWAPLIAASVTTLVNILLAFSTYLGRRDNEDAKLVTEFRVNEALGKSDKAHTAESLTTLRSEVSEIRTRVDGLDRQIAILEMKQNVK